MDSVKALRYSIVGQWLMGAVGIVFSFYEESKLPAALKDYVDSEIERSLTTLEVAFYAIGLLVIFVLIHTSIAIFMLRAWARTPYAFLSIVGVLLYLVIGVQVVTPISGIFDYLASLLIGLTIGLLYFSEVRNYFGNNL